jgi:hypothetical protein
MSANTSSRRARPSQLLQDAEGLAGQPAGEQRLALRPFAEAEFFVEGAEVEFAFLEDAGSVTALEMRQLGGGSNRAKKVN